MTSMTREMNTYLFIFRWILLVIGFSTFSKFNSMEYSWLIILIIANFIFTISIFYNNNKKISLSLIAFDLIYSFLFLLMTEKGMNPFILYSLTTLIWLKSMTKSKSYMAILIVYYFAISFTLFTPLENDVIFWMHQLEFTIYFFFFVWFIVFINYFSAFVKDNHQILFSIYYLVKNFLSEDNFAIIQTKTEEMIIKIFKVDAAYICWTNHKNNQKGWEKHFIQRMYTENQLFTIKKPQYIDLPSFTGKKSTFFYFPIKGDKGSIGGILMSMPNRLRIRRYQYPYFQIISVFLINHLNRIELRKEIAVSLKETVRKKMAQDMHDGLAQQLFFLSAQIFHLKNSLPKNMDPEIVKVITAMEAQMKLSHLEVRSFIKDLRDEEKPHSNLSEAIDKLIKRTIGETSIKIYYETNGVLEAESIEMEKSIYHIVEEAINNVKKHSKASKLSVSLEVTSIQWTIKIADDGIGFHQGLLKENEYGSYGLKGIQERTEQLGGHFYLKTEPLSGTEITAVIPKERGLNYA